MITGFAVVLLMALDTSLAGYRAANGRSGHVRTARRQTRAMALGAALGGFAGSALFASVVLAGGPSPALVAAGERLVLGYGVFGLVLGAAFVARAAPSVDVRAASSVLVFGPFTLVRPVWIVLVAIWAARGTDATTTGILALGVLLVLGIEQLQERWLYRAHP